MELNLFNCSGESIDFDTDQNRCKIVDNVSEHNVVNGIGDIVGGMFVGLVVNASKLLLYVDSSEFDLSNDISDFNYVHKEMEYYVQNLDQHQISGRI